VIRGFVSAVDVSGRAIESRGQLLLVRFRRMTGAGQRLYPSIVLRSLVVQGVRYLKSMV